MSRRSGLAIGAAVVAFAGVTTYVGSISGAPLEFLAADLATGLWFVVAGVAAAWLRPGSSAGPLLLASGALWFVGSYAPSMLPVVSPLGFGFERYYDLALAALLLILSSPWQRLEPRALIAALAGAMAIRSAGRLLLVDGVRTYGCEVCPPNPFAVSTDAAVFEAVEIVSNFAVAALLATVGVVILRRLVTAGPVLRRVRWLILVAGGLAMSAAAFGAFEYSWTTAGNAPIDPLGDELDWLFEWGLFVARILVALSILVATLRMRAAPGPIGSFAAGLDGPPGGGTIGDAVRTTLGDPTLAVLYPAGVEAWRDEAGATATLPPAGGARVVTLVGRADEPLAALVHDRAVSDQAELLDSVVRVLRLALENQRLEGELREQLRAVTDSRQRIVTAAEEERRRLERDLHDGAQQRLVGVSLALRQARGSADAATVPAGLRDQLDAAAHETAEAIRELRELARGIHPAILEDEGLGPAVAALARRAGMPVDVRASVDGRLPPVVESTAYFTIAEALMNAQRHARATCATVSVTGTGSTLRLEVADDGSGGADPARGSGLRGLQDRVAAVGGTFEVDSLPGTGTRVRATIPVA